MSISASVSGVGPGDTASLGGVGFVYSGSGSTVYGPTSSAPTNPGTYTVTPSGGTVTITPAVDQSKYSSTYSYAAGSLVITPAPVVIPVSAPKPKPHPVAATRTVVIKPFAEGSFKLTKVLKLQVRHLAIQIKRHHYRSVSLAGYTDNVFTPAFDLMLIQNRAEVVFRQLSRDLRAMKVSGVRIAIIPGLTIQLVDANTTAKSRALNRRVVATLKAG